MLAYFSLLRPWNNRIFFQLWDIADLKNDRPIFISSLQQIFIMTPEWMRCSTVLRHFFPRELCTLFRIIQFRNFHRAISAQERSRICFPFFNPPNGAGCFLLVFFSRLEFSGIFWPLKMTAIFPHDFRIFPHFPHNFHTYFHFRRLQFFSFPDLSCPQRSNEYLIIHISCWGWERPSVFVPPPSWGGCTHRVEWLCWHRGISLLPDRRSLLTIHPSRHLTGTNNLVVVQ